MSNEEDKQPREAFFSPFLAGVLAWLVPGSGHWYLGYRGRGGVIFFAVIITFFLGIVLGGINIISHKRSKPWFCAQLLCGAPTLISMLVRKTEPNNTNYDSNEPDPQMGFGRGIDLGQVYAGVAGLLNLLCILDVLARKPFTLSPNIQKE